jgi:molybdenum cofactor cytidylyltransferase
MICAIVLAAGRSRRMGTAKLLLPIAGRPLIERVIVAIPQPAVERVFVIVREGDDPLQAALADMEVECVFNPDPGGDMLSSVRCGFRSLPETCEAALVVLGDQPGVFTQLIEALLEARVRAGASLIVPRGPSGRGHPLLVGIEHREEILTAHDGVGLRGLLAAHPGQVQEVEIEDGAALDDVDTPADYARVSERFRCG